MLSESTSIGEVTRSPRLANGQITWDVDVDMFAFRVNAGQSIDIDLNTSTNGPGRLGSYMRFFNSAGQQLAANNDGAAPGESLGFDSFIRHRFSQGGTYYVGVSNWLNTNYNPITGNNDTSSWQHAVGSYSLTLNTTPVSSVPPIYIWNTSDRTAATQSPVEKQVVAEDIRSAPAVVPVSNAAPQDWSIPVRTESNPTTPNASLDDWFASIGQSNSDPFRRLALSI